MMNNNEKFPEKQNLVTSLEDNITLINNIFLGDEMLITRRLQNKYLPSARFCLIYFDEMVDADVLNDNIIRPLLLNNLAEAIFLPNLLEELQYKVINANKVEAVDNIDKITDSIIKGDTLFLVDGFDKALVILSRGWQTRSISEPEASKVVRGPREGFTESITINISLIRRKIKNSDLKFKFKEIGLRTRTNTCICYIEGLALDEILEELERRLDQIEIDSILDSGYIQELIRDAPFSPFETVGYSERPDVIAAKLLEGRIAILVDGSPFVLTVPYVLIEAVQASEDYYNNYIFASINRFMRCAATIFSLSVPSLYLALVTFHQEMLPTPLLLNVAAGRKSVPFPTSLSLVMMLTIFDLLREAGTRMPAPIGQAINIVGTLVLGQAAVEAKIVSPLIIIITAITGILTLINITMIGATIIIRYFLLIFTSILGIYGLLFGALIVIIHLMNIRSFGVPYMLNLSSAKNHNFQDVWFRAPWWEMTLRPKVIAARNLVRQTKTKSKSK